MGFNSSILSSSVKSNNESTIHNESVLYQLLEMNDFVHDIDVAQKISYYRTLSECSKTTYALESHGLDCIVNLHENYTSEVMNRLISIIEKIISFIRNSFKKIMSNHGLGLELYKKYSNRNHEENKENWLVKSPSEQREITVFYYPDIKGLDGITYHIASLNLRLNAILRGNFGERDGLEEKIYKSLAKSLDATANKKVSGVTADKVVDSNSFNQYLKDRFFYTEKESMNAKQYLAHYKSLGTKFGDSKDFIAKTKGIDKAMNESTAMLRNFKNSVSSDQYQAAQAIVDCIRNIGTDYIRLVDMISRFQNKEVVYNNKVYAAYFIGSKEAIKEAGYIHGEEFNSETLFDNEDLRDFNRTEWLDLNLTTEIYEMKYEIMKTYQSLALGEAMIFASNTATPYMELVAMREAAEKSASERLMAIIERIKEFMTKFLNKAKDRFSEYTQYIRKHKATIEKPITIKEAVSRGDILAGMYRVQDGLNIIPFNYDTMKDELKDKETFFKSRILTQLKNVSKFSKRQLKWEDGMSIAEYCKAFYGAGMSEDKYQKCTYTTSDLESNKGNITSFLQNMNYFSAKNDLQALEEQAKRVSKEIPQGTKPASNNANNNEQKSDGEGSQQTQQQQNAETKQENGYFSVLYNQYFTEVELTMADKPAESGNDNGTNEGAKEASEKATAFRVYMECYKDVILAKMTASEFVANELFAIIKAHVRNYTGPEEKETKGGKTEAVPKQQTTEPAK